MTVLRDGDYRPDGQGGLERASGAQAVLEQALFLLTARRGGFPLLPEVGSRLYELPRAKPADRGALGAAYAAQALAALPELEVRGADWDADGPAPLAGDGPGADGPRGMTGEEAR